MLLSVSSALSAVVSSFYGFMDVTRGIGFLEREQHGCECGVSIFDGLIFFDYFGLP